MSQFFDQASLVMVPSGYKNGKVYSQKPLSADGELTFTRASNASRVNADGLIEKVRTNLFPYSSEFTNTWIPSFAGGITAEPSELDPNGQTGTVYRFNGTSGNLYQNTQAINVQYTVSFYVKSGGAGNDTFRLRLGGFESSAFTATSSWVRYTFTNVPTSAVFGIRTDGVGTTNVLIAFAQLEQGDIATDYIATTTAAVSVGPVSGLPRLDYSGGCPALKLEGQRTNYLPYSEDLSQSVTGNVTITTNQTTAPDGYDGGDSIIDNATSGSHNAYKYYTSGSASGTSVVISFFAKKNAHDWCQLASGGNTNDQWANFNLSTGVIGNSSASSNPKIESYANGWYRLSITASTTASSALVAAFITLTNNTNSSNRNPSYSGSGGGVFVWGAQIEEASYATSYIPTLGSAVTRLADTCSKTGISSLIGQTEGTLFLDFNLSISGEAFQSFLIGNGTQRVYFFYYKSTNRFGWSVSLNGTGFGDTFLTFVPSVGNRYKVALAYLNGSNALYINGTLIDSNSSPLGSTTLSDFNFSYVGGSEKFAMPVNQFLLFKTRLTNAQLAELTTL